jgi:hypothetical protein
MLFNIAHSAAPTRAPSPDTDTHARDVAQRRDSDRAARPVLSNPRRIEYLKNYVGQVAPWVGLSLSYWRFCSNFFFLWHLA